MTTPTIGPLDDVEDETVIAVVDAERPVSRDG